MTIKEWHAVLSIPKKYLSLKTRLYIKDKSISINVKKNNFSKLLRLFHFEHTANQMLNEKVVVEIWYNEVFNISINIKIKE